MGQTTAGEVQRRGRDLDELYGKVVGKDGARRAKCKISMNEEREMLAFSLLNAETDIRIGNNSWSFDIEVCLKAKVCVKKHFLYLYIIAIHFFCLLLRRFLKKKK